MHLSKRDYFFCKIESRYDKMTALKSDEEIFEYIKAGERSAFSFHMDTLIEYLPWGLVKRFSEDDDCDTWEQRIPTRENVIEDMRDYMDFAWDKATSHRGLSAQRSVDRMYHWLWLLGDKDMLDEYETIEYGPYGGPKLAYICNKLGFEIPNDPYTQNMANGLPCEIDCDSGCNGSSSPCMIA